MFCPNCSGNLPNDAKFCPNCGTVINAAPQQQYQQPQQQYQQPYSQMQYQQPYGAPPVRRLNTNRGVLKFILLSIITFGIYPIVAFSSISESINIAASRYDGKKTMHFCLLFFIISPITAGIGMLVWFHKVSNRIGNECSRRGIAYSFGASDFWIFEFLLSFTIVCPFIYLHKLFKATNLVCEDYNRRG